MQFFWCTNKFGRWDWTQYFLLCLWDSNKFEQLRTYLNLPALRLMHCPPWWHGCFPQRFTLCWHLLPLKPFAHLHLKINWDDTCIVRLSHSVWSFRLVQTLTKTTCDAYLNFPWGMDIHVPPCLHGSFSQAFMAFSQNWPLKPFLHSQLEDKNYNPFRMFCHVTFNLDETKTAKEGHQHVSCLTVISCNDNDNELPSTSITCIV